MGDKQEEIICKCSKAEEIVRIQKDLQQLAKEYKVLFAQINNGISEKVPEVIAAIKALTKEFHQHELAHERTTGEASGKRKNLWRIFGSVAITFTVMFCLGGLIILLLATNLITPEGIGIIIERIIP
jgi:anti-sigma-K factor RskA